MSRFDRFGSRSGRPGIVVVGGGISGLSAALRLAETADHGVPVRLLEASDRLGGFIRTERKDGLLLEAGPDSLVTQKPAGKALCERLGLGPDLIYPANPSGGMQVVHRGRLRDVPKGFAMVGPARILPFLSSPLFSWSGKLRILCEPFIAARREGTDESLRDFVTRRFGREAFERVAEPVVAGLFTADADTMSLRMRMPRILDLERAHGNVTLALRRAARSRSGGAAFVTLRHGLESIVDRIASRLSPGRIHTGTAVAQVTYRPADRHWIVRTTSGDEIRAEAVVLASPAHAAAEQVRDLDSDLAAELSRLEYASCATVSLAYRRRDLGAPVKGFGFFVPRGTPMSILAANHVSEKFVGRAPDDLFLTRTFVGGALRPDLLDFDDDALVRRSHEALSQLMRIRELPVSSTVHRQPRSMPQYEVGDAARVERIERLAGDLPGLTICGGSVGAVGIPDCVQAGERAADRALRFVTAQGTPRLELAN